MHHFFQTGFGGDFSEFLSRSVVSAAARHAVGRRGCLASSAGMAREMRGRAKAPPIADYRNKTGNFQRKAGRSERREVENRAIARKQEAGLPVRKIALWMTIFGILCAILYLYLAYVVADDEDEELETE